MVEFGSGGSCPAARNYGPSPSDLQEGTPGAHVEAEEETVKETRDQRIVRECEESGEPFFVLRAKDRLAPAGVAAYGDVAEANDCDEDFLGRVNDRVAEFQAWQEANPGRVKTPDLRPDES